MFGFCNKYSHYYYYHRGGIVVWHAGVVCMGSAVLHICGPKKMSISRTSSYVPYNLFGICE